MKGAPVVTARLVALTLLTAAVAWRSAAAQVGATTDIITGRVTGPDSQPLAGALVQATSVETRVTRERTTDARGRFTIVFPDGGGRYEVTARFIGLAATQITVARQAEEDRIETTIRMGLRAESLEPVTVSAPSNRSDRVGPGATERNLNPESLTRLPIDVSDVNTVATLLPGVLGIRESDSTTTAFSVAGQRPTANNITLDGVTFGSGSVPQDAVRSIRVVTNGYDVARGQFSGGLVASTTRGGTNVPQGAFTYALRDRSLEWGELTQSPFGQGTTQNQLGGGMGGPIVSNRLFAFAALQGRWREQALPSLTTADPATLVRFGVSPDSVARFVTLTRAAGAPATVPGLPDDRNTNGTLALLRLDWRATDVHTLTLRLDGSWESQEPTRVGTFALPATGGTRTTRGGGVMAALTSYFGGRFINELRGYVARQRRDAHAYLVLPAATVLVASDLPGGGQGVTGLSFGGNGGLPQHVNNRSVEVADEFSWLPGPTAHRLKVGVDVIGTRVEESQASNPLGWFWFPSLGALAADSPAMFIRTLAPLTAAGTAWTSAGYVGDTWRAGGGGGSSVQLTYGARLEASHFSGAPLYNRAADSLFAVRTDRIPSEVHLSPRIGFSWAFGHLADGPQSTFLRGGVGVFRSLTPTTLYSAALGAPGLASAETELICVGAAVPIPDWSRYAQDPSAIPSQCTDTANAVVIMPQPNITAFAPGFTAPRARRASLGLLRRFPGNYWVTLEASYARGVSQYGFRDLNLVGTPRFALADEAGRPVYVPADSIIPATGALSATGSRRYPQFGTVLLIRSDLQSDTRQLTASFTGVIARSGSFRLAYTLTRARDQSSFSCCGASRGLAAQTTGGDPGMLEWATSDLEQRHAFLGTVSYPVTRALEISAIGRLNSGIPFTPMVGRDINGDGARNDRAFIFDPATAQDTAVANGMRTLLSAAPSAVRSCLRSQLGRIAARNSCTGPWQPTLDLQINWRPSLFGADRRLIMSLLTVNLLGGLDQWLHGAGHLHGWGYATTPEPVLLEVRGFDPTAHRFLYQVNGRFGATTTATGGLTVPFQVAVQAHIAVGPGPIRRSATRQRALDLPAPATPPPANPITPILGLRDSLGCTADQVAQLQAIADSLDARNRLVPESLDAVRASAARDNAAWALERARAALTPAQWSKVPDALKSPPLVLND